MRRNKRRERDLAEQRIIRLLRMADEAYLREPELAMRYGELAKRISLRTNVRIPKEWRWRFCKRCGGFLYPGVNAEVRAKGKRMPHLVIRCGLCGAIRRVPYLREKKARRSISRSRRGGLARARMRDDH
mgnify:CR=1 FL=1